MDLLENLQVNVDQFNKTAKVAGEKTIIQWYKAAGKEDMDEQEIQPLPSKHVKRKL